MDDNWDIDTIKDEHLKTIRNREVFMIVAGDYGWQVQWWTKDSVAPQVEKDTPQEAVARVLQLMGIKEAVSPQDWPEDVCVGRIEIEKPGDEVPHD